MSTDHTFQYDHDAPVKTVGFNKKNKEGGQITHLLLTFLNKTLVRRILIQ